MFAGRKLTRGQRLGPERRDDRDHDEFTAEPTDEAEPPPAGGADGGAEPNRRPKVEAVCEIVHVQPVLVEVAEALRFVVDDQHEQIVATVSAIVNDPV